MTRRARFTLPELEHAARVAVATQCVVEMGADGTVRILPPGASLPSINDRATEQCDRLFGLSE